MFFLMCNFCSNVASFGVILPNDATKSLKKGLATERDII